MKTKILLAVVLVLIVIQFIRPARNLAAAPSPADITAHYATPPAVKQTLAVACYDCHSDNTRYRWYYNVQPVGWWMADHIKEGRGHLDFSQFATYDPTKAAKKLRGIAFLVEKHKMPIDSYKWLHPDARLTDAQTKELADWANAIRAQIIAAHPEAGRPSPPRHPRPERS